jgi:hypothetical protein
MKKLPKKEKESAVHWFMDGAIARIKVFHLRRRPVSPC